MVVSSGTMTGRRSYPVGEGWATVLYAQMTFAFHMFLAVMLVSMWFEDDEKKEEELSKTFYNSSVAGTMLALSVALPHENCNIHVMEWFLYAGIIYNLTGVINQVRERGGGYGNLGWNCP